MNDNKMELEELDLEQIMKEFGDSDESIDEGQEEVLVQLDLDVDDLIVEAAGKTLPEILRTDGLDAFVELEGRVGEELNFEDTVIATGGSMVLSGKAMEHLKENGVVVWLETPISQISDRMPEDLVDRGIAAPSGMNIREIYEHRKPLYARYADLIVASREGEDSTAQLVEEIMRTVGIEL